jgi:uncharacterized Zn finger protein (UPF0148 family)
MTTSKPQCCTTIYRSGGAFSGSQCAKPVTFNLDGKMYCATHFPPNVITRRNFKEAAYQAKREEERNLRQKIAAERAEIQRKAECFDDLLAALQEIERLVDFESMIGDIARAAIKKATS